GDDIQPGDLAVRAGAVLGPAHIGLLAATGRDQVLVSPRPRVAVMSYGLELVDIGRDPGLGHVFDVTSYALAAAARDAGADVQRVGIINAEPRRLKETIANHVARSEMIIIAGAVGGSGAQAAQEALAELGEIDTSRVAMHPGSVQGFGLLGEERIPAFLLPSNPAAALVIFETIVRPAIRRSLGKQEPKRRAVQARSLGPLDSIPGRRGFVRARLMRDADTGDYLVQGLGGAEGVPSHLLAGFADANAIIELPEEVTTVRPGDIVDVVFLQQRS
ncbi:gephyrin-like molybdotransferase Glp, partial [Corynebacterium sp.]|uniref:molybdopterin-binding protein n=1 Tax=Corynebacterium sp. TaxID=1720 RepID=UPI002A90960C